MVMSIENFFQKFIADNRPYWKLFKGLTTKTTIKSQMQEGLSIDDSWEMLRNELNRFDSGTFTIVTFAKQTCPTGKGWSSVVKVGSAVGSSASHSPVQSQPQKVDNMQFFQMMQYFQEQSDKRADAERKAADERAERDLKFQLQMLELKQSNAQLAGALDAPPDDIKQEFYRELINNIPDVIEGIKGIFTPKFPVVQNAQLGTLGQKDNTETSSDAPADATENAPTPPKRGVSFDRLAVSAQKIQKSLPQFHVNDVVDLFAAFAEQNPKQAAMIINQLKGE